MKQMLLVCLAVCLFCENTFAQSQPDKLGARLRYLLHRQTGHSIYNHAEKKSPGMILPVLIKGRPEQVRNFVESHGCFYSALGDIAAASLSLPAIAELATLSDVEHIERAVKLRLTNDRAAEHVGARLVLHGEKPLQQACSGKGVLIGIIDSGIDFRHRDFRSEDGRQSRILFVWDQADDRETPASDVPYGKIWHKSDFEADFNGYEHGRVRHLDVIGHGTHVSGTAGGNGNAVNQYQGMAPEAEFIVVALDFDAGEQMLATRIIEALDFIARKAELLQRPVVVNASLTTQDGAHDGTSLLEQAIENFLQAAPGRAFCAAAGNAGNTPIHWGALLEKDSIFTYVQEVNQAYTAAGEATLAVYGRVESDRLHDTFFAVAADSFVSETGRFFPLSTGKWISFDSLITAGIWSMEVVASDGHPLGSVEMSSYQRSDGICEFYLFISDNVYANNMVESGSRKTWGFDFWRLMARGNGKIDYWLQKDWSVNSRNLEITHPRYQPCDTKLTVGIPATGKSVIAVGAYNNLDEFINFHGNPIHYGAEPPEVGALAYFSSKGPAADDRVKPEIIAPGHQVVSSHSSAAFVSPFRNAILAPGKQHILGTGTSMACPVVSGSIALYFEQNPTATIEDVREALFKSCSSDQFTATTGVLPNPVWGYGKLDIFNAMSGVGRNILASTNAAEFKLFQNYPNPFNPRTELVFDLPTADIVDVDVFSITGRKIVSLLHQQNMPRGRHRLEFDGTNLSTGVYLYQVRTSKFRAAGKMLLVR